jgi:hypothetical protein
MQYAGRPLSPGLTLSAYTPHTALLQASKQEFMVRYSCSAAAQQHSSTWYGEVTEVLHPQYSLRLGGKSTTCRARAASTHGLCDTHGAVAHDLLLSTSHPDFVIAIQLLCMG